jgi:hypothetical protein
VSNIVQTVSVKKKGILMEFHKSSLEVRSGSPTMIIVRGILEVLVVISAPSMVFVVWMFWRAREAEDNAASRAAAGGDAWA